LEKRSNKEFHGTLLNNKKERTLLFLVPEAAEEKAHGASGMDLSSSGGKELKCKCRGILH
jgi:hypothetical protein